MDIADRADELIEHNLKVALSNLNIEHLPSIGCCYNCQEPLSDRRFCDTDCRDDWQKREQKKAREKRSKHEDKD